MLSLEIYKDDGSVDFCPCVKSFCFDFRTDTLFVVYTDNSQHSYFLPRFFRVLGGIDL